MFIIDWFQREENERNTQLLSRVEAMREQWRKEKRHLDALRDMEQDSEYIPYDTPIEKGLMELLKLLQMQDMTDNCDTTHRIYLTEEQFDIELFDVQNKYRFCPKCRRFYNKELLSGCKCNLVSINN